MGGALFSTLDDGFWCATLEIKFNYHVGVREGRLICEASVLHKGKRVANIDARLFQHDRLVASANGNLAIFPAPTAGSAKGAGSLTRRPPFRSQAVRRGSSPSRPRCATGRSAPRREGTRVSAPVDLGDRRNI